MIDGKLWQILTGDCMEIMRDIPDDTGDVRVWIEDKPQ